MLRDVLREGTIAGASGAVAALAGTVAAALVEPGPSAVIVSVVVGLVVAYFVSKFLNEKWERSPPADLRRSYIPAMP